VLVLSRKMALRLVAVGYFADIESVEASDQYLISDELPVVCCGFGIPNIEDNCRPSINDCFDERMSWQKMNRGNFSKKDRRK